MTTSASPYTILHLGTGSFHRAHQAWYLHTLREQGNLDWSLTVGNIRGDGNAVLDALAAQNGVYTLETVDPKGERRYETIRSIQQVLPWRPDLANLVAVGADPRTRIISFTVTEGGYYLDEHHRLDTANPDLAADLGGARTTIYGALRAILHERMTSDAGPLTLQNCDNLRSNGERFHAGMRAFLTAVGDNALLSWFDANTRSPNAMVDRIVPRPGPDVRERVTAAGFDDVVPVMGERFIQWVIEDDFIAGRPHWEKVGVQLVDSVLPYEEAKIRILNATHSCIAWAGTLAGLQYIHEGTHDPAIRQAGFDYVTQDVIPSLSPSPIDLAAYRDTVLDRFSNPNIRDTNQRVAADGFSKIPGFIAPTLRERIAAGQPFDATARLPALFFVFLEAWHEGKLPYDYQDGVMDPVVAHGFFESANPLSTFTANTLLWGSLAGSSDLRDAIGRQVADVRAWLASLQRT
ncbi:D-arabinitol 4-dehydrogenase [Robbsia andropogonis]|uniref:D-arabinitol 4-dehydrogenase n=1 Tax=Robbsia andropogonis TaxID=28092 RepID=UPI0004648C6F|nr:D-arabinitol 4-dehydrogenase [Robbsia andropogonis]MCP1120927.1 mannitol dehydrogenase family protein [Robbsia andropogonis]MCP1130699.1 mannitol dehydrogenase family protein [Robbsia andropogonis]